MMTAIAHHVAIPSKRGSLSDLVLEKRDRNILNLSRNPLEAGQSFRRTWGNVTYENAYESRNPLEAGQSFRREIREEEGIILI